MTIKNRIEKLEKRPGVKDTKISVSLISYDPNDPDIVILGNKRMTRKEYAAHIAQHDVIVVMPDNGRD